MFLVFRSGFCLGDIDPHPETKLRPGSGQINALSTSGVFSSSLLGKLSEAEMKRLVTKKVSFAIALSLLIKKYSSFKTVVIVCKGEVGFMRVGFLPLLQVSYLCFVLLIFTLGDALMYRRFDELVTFY